MKLPPKCIVSDLDRTLTGADLVLDKKAVTRVRALRERGILVVLATGRTLEALTEMGLPREMDAVVAENGAIVAIPPRDVLEVVDPSFGDRARAALRELASQYAWGRVLGSGLREVADETARRLKDAGVAHLLEYNAQEVMLLPAGVDKAHGVARALELLGVDPDDAWAIGDGENDVSMLRLVGVGAVGANAVPLAAAAADVRLTASYSEAFLELTRPLVEPRRATPG